MNATAWPAMPIARAHELLTGAGSPLEMETKVIRGVETRVWKNAPPTLKAGFLLGRTFGDRDFLVHEDERVTFEGFARATLTLAHRFIVTG